MMRAHQLLCRFVSLITITAYSSFSVLTQTAPLYADRIIEGASQGQQAGVDALGRMATQPPSTSSSNPTANNRSSSSRVFIPEVIPGADPQKLSEIENFGQSMLDDPKKIQTNAMNYWLDIQKVGCRKTTIHFVDSHVTLKAYRYLKHRQNGSTQSYNVPWTLALGSFKTLGVTDKITKTEKYDDTWDLVTVIEISPFPQPRDGTFFTYNHRITSGVGVISSYGTLNDGFSTQGSVTGAVIEVTADLYRVERTYLRNPDGTPISPCPPDPPDPCQMSGVNWCDGKASGVAAVIQGTASSFFGEQGAYNYANKLMIDRFQNQRLPDLSSDASFARGLNITDAMMRGVDPLVNSLFGGCTVSSNTTNNTITVHEPEIHTCSGVFTEANGCEWTRQFNFTKGETKNILTVRQFCKQPDGSYQQCPITTLPNMTCPDGATPLKLCGFGSPSTWQNPVDDNTYHEYYYTPFYGSSESGFTWNDHENCSVGSSECTHSATAYYITQNDINGCKLYKDMMWDGWCEGKITCTDYRSCVTIEDVTFCDGDPIAEEKIIKKIQTYPYPPTHPKAGTPIFPPMCWAGRGEKMECEYYIGTEECYTDVHGQVHCPTTDGGEMTHHADLCPGPSELCPYFVDDCEYQQLYGNSECKYVGFECAENARGLYSGICYAVTLKYDCGKDVTYQNPGQTSTVELCDSALRCLGTECHNVRGETNHDFARAVGAVTAVELMQNDFVCAETGEPPTDEQIQNGQCTIRVFEGENLKCKIPIGHEVGLTPNCCKEGLKAASGVSAVDYLLLAFAMINLAKNPLVVKGLAQVPGTAPVFNLFEEMSNIYSSITQFLKGLVNDTFVSMAEHFGFKIGTGAAEEAAKQAAQTGFFEGLKQQIMWKAYDFISQVFGPDLANSIFTVSGEQIMLNATISSILNFIAIVYTVWNILKIIGHIVFACEEDELKLGIQRKMGNCTYVGSYCAQKALFTCIVKKESYCCYHTPLARIIMEQVRKQLGGFGSAKNPNCKGLTVDELANVNWDSIDLSEWEARLQEAGIIPKTPEEVEERWGKTFSQHFQRETMANDLPGPDGDGDKGETNQTRMNNYAGAIMEGKSVLDGSPYCWTDPEQTLQYPLTPPGPDDKACIYPP